MALTISEIARQEKNKLGTDSVWYILVELCLSELPSGSLPNERIVSNAENVVWNGEIWQAANFKIDEIGDTVKDEIPRVAIMFANIDRSFQLIIQQYDTYCKNYGVTPVTIKIYFVNSKNLGSSIPEVEYNFTIQELKSDANFVTIVLGGKSLYNKVFPTNRVIKNFCRFKYKDGRCASTSHLTTCNKTINDCITRNNISRFGNFPNAGVRGLKIGG